MSRLVVLSLLAVAVLGGLLACGQRTAAPTPSPAATPSPTPVVMAEGEGKKLYTQYCAACHGPNAEGTQISPALPGHEERAVVRQVRSPMGNMPSFRPSQLSDEALIKIAQFIASLPVPEKHVEPVEMPEPVVVHHWMAIFALKDEDMQEALHHIDHIIAGVTDPKHKHSIEEAKEMITAGKPHDAEHEVEEMLAGKAQSDMGMGKLHLKLAITDIALKDAADAKHHMEHFRELASGQDRAKAEETLKLLVAGDLHEAEHHIEELMGPMPHK